MYKVPLSFLPNWLGSMILMVVVATDSIDDEPSKQLTTVSFRLLLTGLAVILDISGKLSGPESLVAVKVELLIVTTGGSPLEPMDERTVILVVIATGMLTVTSHL